MPETEGNELNTKEAYQMISRAIDNEATEVDLESDPKAYKKADVTRDSAELQDIVNAYNNLAKANITYTFGDETVTLDGNTIKDWLQFDEKGQLLQDDGAFRQHVVDYVAQLAADHDTVGTERQFQTTSGRTVYVYGSAYGWKIDQDGEVAQLMQEIQSGTQTTNIFHESKCIWNQRFWRYIYRSRSYRAVYVVLSERKYYFSIRHCIRTSK